MSGEISMQMRLRLSPGMMARPVLEQAWLVHGRTIWRPVPVVVGDHPADAADRGMLTATEARVKSLATCLYAAYCEISFGLAQERLAVHEAMAATFYQMAHYGLAHFATLARMPDHD